MRHIIWFVFSFCALQVSAQRGIITTVAGTGSGSYTGDGGPATAAGLGIGPGGLVIDKSGNIYVSIRLQHRIRKISVSGIITCYAGTGVRGYSGDGGVATAAKLDNPGYLALDSSDNLFVAEIEGSRVRRIDQRTGTITTFAGNGGRSECCDGISATAASFHFGYAICFDHDQNLYIGTGEAQLRKVDATTGIISTYAGGDTSVWTFSGDRGPASGAEFRTIGAVCMDTGDNLLIADWQSSRIRRIDARTGIINTIAGNDSFTYNGEGLLATVANINPHSALACDNNGHIFLGSVYQYRLQKIDAASNRVYTIAGTGRLGYSIDGALADTSQVGYVEQLFIDPCNNIYFSEGGTKQYVKKITYPYGNKAEVVIAAQGGNRLCYGMPVSFRAFAPLAGSSGRYQWRVNGSNVGPNSPTFTYTPANGDVVDCILTSSLYCVVNPMDTSNAISMTVFSLSPVSLTISGTTLASVGDTVTLTAAITGTGLGGYRISWLNRGVLQDTTTTATYRYVKGAGNDTITAILTSQSRNCYDSAYSNPHVVVRNTVGIAIPIKSSITLWPNPTGNVLHYSGLTHTGTLTITDLAGRQVLSTTLTAPTGTADLTPLTPGHYLAHLTDTQTGERVVRKVEKR
jgi:sugar lactone lactonase YvrE